jgi:hypothetical protein
LQSVSVVAPASGLGAGGGGQLASQALVFALARVHRLFDGGPLVQLAGVEAVAVNVVAQHQNGAH